MTRGITVTVKALTEGFDAAMREKYRPLAEAGQETIIEIANDIKIAGRADIAAAGFSARWQNALRAEVYPKRKVSLNAATLVFHKIPYADVFETGATISGKPTLWLPLSSTPKKLGRFKMTADRYAKEVGPLTLLKLPGKRPLLAAKMAVSGRQAASGDLGKVTLPKLRRGASGSGAIRAVPLFVGVDSVTLRKRFGLNEVIERAAGRIEAVFVDRVAKKDID